MMIGGFRIIESTLMVKDGEPYEDLRSWKERLFTRPWRPFKRIKTIVPKVPSEEFYLTANGVIMHPVMAAKLKREFEREHFGAFI